MCSPEQGYYQSLEKALPIFQEALHTALVQVNTKLPKQWKHWVKKAGLKLSGRRKYDRWYLTGHDRHWRVNSSLIFECSCPTEHFDRWANSSGAQWIGIPKDEEEFLAAVKVLLEDSRNAK